MMNMTGEGAKAGAQELQQRMAGALETVQQLPQVATPDARQHLDDMLAANLIHVNMNLGEQMTWRHAWFTVVKIEYPFVVLELCGTSKGFEHQDAKAVIGDRLVWKSAYMVVRSITPPYLVFEITGITDRLEKKIALGKAAKALAEKRSQNVHGVRTGKRKKGRRK